MLLFLLVYLFFVWLVFCFVLFKNTAREYQQKLVGEKKKKVFIKTTQNYNYIFVSTFSGSKHGSNVTISHFCAKTQKSQTTLYDFHLKIIINQPSSPMQ